MKKNIWLTIMMVLVLALGCIGVAHAEVIPALGAGQIGYQAVVLCEELTVRQQANASSKAVKTLHYGDHMIVYKQSNSSNGSNGFAQIFLSDAVDAEPAGWVNAEYIAINPSYFRTDSKTPVYAWNSTSAPKVALLDKGETLPILKKSGDWMIVSLRGTVGCVKK